MKPGSVEWFIQVIGDLPSDNPVANRTPGYNNYPTQKEHWLGWLNPNSGTGTYPRASRPDRDAQYVYNHIMEPKMLLWLVSAARVSPELIQGAVLASESCSLLASKAAVVRKCIPWHVLSTALTAFGAAEV